MFSIFAGLFDRSAMHHQVAECNDDALIVADERDSPLHVSVQRVHHSLVELSRLLKLHHTPMKGNALLETKCDHPHEGVICEDGKANFSPKKPCKFVQSPKSASADSLDYTATTTSFFDEVLSAVDNKLSSFQHVEEVDSNISTKKNVYTNVLEWNQALRKVSETKNNSSFKLGSTKKRYLKHTMSMQDKKFHNNSTNYSECETVVRRYSDTDQSSVKINNFLKFSKESESYDPGCSLVPESINLFTSPKHKIDLNASSCLGSYKSINESNSSFLLKSQEESKRKYSLTSADLEDIFSDFADRSNSSNAMLSENSALRSNEKQINELKEPTMSRSCQTELNFLDTQSVKKKATSVVALKPLFPASPPMMDDFFQRTGNWDEVLSQQHTYKLPKTQKTKKLDSCINNNELFRPSESCIFALHCNKSKTSSRLFQPAGRFKWFENPKPTFMGGSSNEQLGTETSSNEKKKSLPLTPSKLPFRSKVSLFESQTRNSWDHRPVSAGKVPNTLNRFLHPLRRTNSLDVISNRTQSDLISDTNKRNLKQSEDVSKIGDNEFHTSTPRFHSQAVFETNRFPNIFTVKNYLPHPYLRKLFSSSKEFPFDDLSTTGTGLTNLKKNRLPKTLSLPELPFDFIDDKYQIKNASIKCYSKSEISVSTSMIESGINSLANKMVNEILCSIVMNEEHFKVGCDARSDSDDVADLSTSLWTNVDSTILSQREDSDREEKGLF